MIYLLSHMAIMPLIDLLLTGLEWMPNGDAAFGLILFLGLSFVNGCVLEIGRKLWAPESEITGVDTYSGLWGPRKSAQVWGICVLTSFTLLIGVGIATGVFWVTVCLGGAGAVICLINAWKYANAPTERAEKWMDSLAGLWVFSCYAIAGFAPVLMRVL